MMRAMTMTKMKTTRMMKRKDQMTLTVVKDTRSWKREGMNLTTKCSGGIQQPHKLHSNTSHLIDHNFLRRFMSWAARALPPVRKYLHRLGMQRDRDMIRLLPLVIHQAAAAHDTFI